MDPLTYRFNQARERIHAHGQEHLLQYYDSLSDNGKTRLVDQVLAIDFELMSSLYEGLVVNKTLMNEEETIEPMPVRVWDAFSVAEKASLVNAGKRALRDGKVAAFLVAGGQGSRLGHEGPKGTFNIGLPSGKSLFQLQAERLLNLSRQVDRTIPWYIMTSPDNSAQTTGFFQEKKYFGYPEKDIFFFSQGLLPMVDEEGKIIMADQGHISQGPNGNGGCFPALAESGALADMKIRGVEHIFFYSVDNVLVKVADPAFIGFAIHSGSPVAGKAVKKSGPEEKVGVFCLRNGKPSVLEYSDMPEALRNARGPDKELLFNAGSIAIHLFQRDFLEKNAKAALPFHVAHKKIEHLGRDGAPLRPQAPNAYKFELFMFDLFPRAESMAALMVRREEEFAPVKNGSGPDSPETARTLTLDLHKRWAAAALGTEEPLEGKIVEISPLTSYAGENLNPAVIRAQLVGDTVMI